MGNTDKTVGHILKEFMEVRMFPFKTNYQIFFGCVLVGTKLSVCFSFFKGANNHLEVYAADIPYIQSFRVPDVTEISLPETLFLNL